jgi:hypothetical protein
MIIHIKYDCEASVRVFKDGSFGQNDAPSDPCQLAFVCGILRKNLFQSGTDF